MNRKLPKIDSRDSALIYVQALGLARHYCPEWENAAQDAPDKEDIGLVLLALLSRLVETVIGQVNRIPEKHQLAFYDFAGMDHLPPEQAVAPLTFALAEGKSEACVPERTRVSSSLDPTVVFETMEALTAVKFGVKAVYSLNPWQDTYADHREEVNGSETGFALFNGNRGIEHALYLADTMFDFKTPVNATIRFSGDIIDFKTYFSEWSDGGGNPLSSQPEINVAALSVTFKNLTIPKTVKDGKEANWLVVKPAGPLTSGGNAILPQFNGISLNVSANGIKIDNVFCNDSPIDVKKGFSPFGQTPKRGDALYISCGEAFSRKGATISIVVDLKGGTADAGTTLVWEYWNGSKWTALSILSDTTNKFTSTGSALEVKFTGETISAAEINGVPGMWIRVRIDSGGYGGPGGYAVEPVANVINSLTAITDQGVKNTVISALTNANIALGGLYKAPSYNPPFINAISCAVSFSSESSGRTIRACKKYNNFHFENIDVNLISESNRLKPFETAPAENPAVYIGFEEYPVNKPLSLYFSQKSRTYGIESTKINKPGYTLFSDSDMVRGLVWTYHNGSNWQKFSIEDGTGHFIKSDMIKFVVPSDIKKKTEFGVELYWIRVSLKEGSWYELPVLSGIFANTVWAENASVIKNETLGSSNGQPNQIFRFSSKPVLGNQIVEIKEPGIPTTDELAEIMNDEDADPVRLIKNDSGDIREIWVRWKEVNSLAQSTPVSRHYIIDRVEGQIVFGDGIRGMIPPALPNTILAREYKSGGGRKGNQLKDMITVMKSAIPGVKKVSNRDSASGGADLETISNVVTRAPFSLKNSGRAVIKEDFEWLAREASPDVSKARCVNNGHEIKVIIAPRYDTGVIYPEPGLLEQVSSYLQDRAFLMVKDRVKVVGPAYRRIDVEATVVPVHLSESAIVADRVERKLRGFLHPITGGGDNGLGWDFGQGIYISEIAALIEDVEGVDHITALALKKLVSPGVAEEASISGNTRIAIGDAELPYAGNILVHIIGIGGAD